MPRVVVISVLALTMAACGGALVQAAYNVAVYALIGLAVSGWGLVAALVWAVFAVNPPDCWYCGASHPGDPCRRCRAVQ